jgi:hypothetical protein
MAARVPYVVCECPKLRRPLILRRCSASRYRRVFRDGINRAATNRLARACTSPALFIVPIADTNPQIAGLDEEIEREHSDLIKDRFYPKVTSGQFGTREELRHIAELAQTFPHLALGLPQIFVSAPAYQRSTCADPTLSRKH